MDNNDMIIIGTSGDAVNLNEIRTVTAVEKIIGDKNQERGYLFKLLYKGIKKDDALSNMYYLFDNYSDSKEELKIKIENIRLEILRRMNNGRVPHAILGNINLRK